MTAPNFVAKGVAVAYFLFAIFIFGPFLKDSRAFYWSVSDEAFAATPKPAAMAMKHLSFVFTCTFILMAAIIVCLIFTHQAPRLGMSMIFTFWGIKILANVIEPWPHTQGLHRPTLLGIEFTAEMAIILWIPLALAGYYTAEHDLEAAKKAKKS
jgi:hypothetical protein